MDSVRLAFTIAAMNNLNACAADISTAFLCGKAREKVCIMAGKEFGPLAGKPLIVDKSCYGLKSSAAAFHSHCSEKIRRMGFKPSKMDPDLYIRKAKNKDHYEMLACYVDDIIAFSEHPGEIIDEFRKTCMLKGVEEPKYYLGGDVQTLNEHWQKQGTTLGLLAKTYIKNIMKKFQTMLKTNFKSEDTPMAEGDHPELDESDFCTPLQHAQFRALDRKSVV